MVLARADSVPFSCGWIDEQEQAPKVARPTTAPTITCSAGAGLSSLALSSRSVCIGQIAVAQRMKIGPSPAHLERESSERLGPLDLGSKDRSLARHS